jgi:tRNA(fMet)-specific endonuclease VapC
MLTHLLDTNVSIQVLKRRSAELEKRFTENGGRMALSDVSLYELFHGAQRYEDPSQRLNVIETFATRLEILPFDSRAALQAGQIRADLERKGQMIGAYDIMIAGCARSQGLVLVTGNLREFQKVDGLRLENWS